MKVFKIATHIFSSGGRLGSSAGLKRSGKQFRYHFLMHVNLTDQRLGRIWSYTSNSTLSKQVIPLVFHHDVKVMRGVMKS